MRRREYFQDLLLAISNYEGISDTALDDYLCEDQNVVAACNILMGLVHNDNLKILLQNLEEIIDNAESDSSIEDDIFITGSVAIIDFSLNNFQKFNREFVYTDLSFGFFSSNSLFESSILINIARLEHQELWKQIEDYCMLSMQMHLSGNIDALIKIIALANSQLGYLINKTGSTLDPLRIYSYIYLSYLNDGKFLDIDQALIYSSRKLNSNLVITNLVEYEQYIDILDVLNEVNLSKDILTRFLKDYHILEFLTYRVSLVKIVRGTIRGKSFVRQIIRFSDRIKNSEKSTFVENFNVLFNGDSGFFTSKITTHINPGVQRFIQDTWNISGFVPSDINNIAHLIYAIRCSIVHNKEGEEHFTISYPSDFSLIVSLIKEIIEALEFIIIEKISTNQIKIQFPQKELELY
jgi:hypothetical protein